MPVEIGRFANHLGFIQPESKNECDVFVATITHCDKHVTKPGLGSSFVWAGSRRNNLSFCLWPRSLISRQDRRSF